MSAFSAYAAKKLLDQIFGATAWTAPTPLYFALFTVMPDDAGAGGTEVTGGSYARVSVTNNTTNFPASTGTLVASKASGAAVTFATATADWGTVVGWGIYDASSGGNLIFTGLLTTSKVVANTDTPSFATGALVLGLD